ncbi:MAG TPA: UMP kinase [Spirochaetales bacterium]|nr:UMP kinase [Spirochaetales bacterium]
MLYVVSLGGSIVSPPSGPDAKFLADLTTRLAAWLESDAARRIILIVGGGEPARSYQEAYRQTFALLGKQIMSNDALDWIGIAATRLNAQLVKQVLSDYCPDDVVTDPSGPIEFTGRVLVAAGWKPGFSTDYDAVYLAERFGARLVLNLSNISQVYTADPKRYPDAKPIDAISWEEFQKLVGTTWNPGANLPFDPIASSRAAAANVAVVCANGRNLDNVFNILDEKPYLGTLIGARPEANPNG